MIFDGPTMPIVGPGETANDKYIEQLVASAEAAVNKAVELGNADRSRIAVGGHRYVTLPHEAHGYQARESNMHVVTETLNWLDYYVKSVQSRGPTSAPR